MQIVHSDFQDQLVRGLSHRMNNILTLFHGYLGLLLENKDLDPSTVDGLAKIKKGAAQASDLMERTHALIRPISTILREIKLADYLGLLLPTFESLCGPKTNFSMEVADELPSIHGDVSRVRTAIMEMVKNACEATFASGGDVRMTVRCEAARGSRSRWIVISVTDEGPGIPEELTDRIMVPFFSTKKKQNSAGLGLTVIQSFAQQQGGAMSFESEPGQTTFELRLPAMAA